MSRAWGVVCAVLLLLAGCGSTEYHSEAATVAMYEQFAASAEGAWEGRPVPGTVGASSSARRVVLSFGGVVRRPVLVAGLDQWPIGSFSIKVDDATSLVQVYRVAEASSVPGVPSSLGHAVRCEGVEMLSNDVGVVIAMRTWIIVVNSLEAPTVLSVMSVSEEKRQVLVSNGMDVAKAVAATSLSLVCERVGRGSR